MANRNESTLRPSFPNRWRARRESRYTTAWKRRRRYLKVIVLKSPRRAVNSSRPVEDNSTPRCWTHAPIAILFCDRIQRCNARLPRRAIEDGDRPTRDRRAVSLVIATQREG